MNDNPLLDLSGLPPFHLVTPAHVEPAIRELVRRADDGLTALEKHAPPTWDTVERLMDLHEPLGNAWGLVNHLMGVRNSPELRTAHQAVQPDVVMCFMRASQSEPLFKALQGLRGSPEWATLDGAQQRAVDKRILDARLSGMALPAAQRDRFNAIEQELSDLETQFANHVLDATKAWALTLTRPDEIDGLPQSLLALAAGAARSAGDPAATPERGPWRITLDAPSVSPFLRHARRRDLRERVYRAYVTRASDGPLDNGPLIDRLLALRLEKAKLLDFNTYAELSLATKMAPGVDAVWKLLEDLREKSMDAARKDLDELVALNGGQALALWDVDFLSERLRESRFNYTEEELRPYFPLPRALEGLFALAGRLFGVTVSRADGEAPTWHPDVMFFRVTARDGAPVAAFYLDPYSRPADKRGGAWADECVARRRRRGGAGARMPVSYLCCNQTPPVDGKPSLMTFREVETLFHEFGHGLQHMLTRVDVSDVSGIRGIEWDAVELPSQFMENWCYHRETLLGLSRHVDTGAPLPDALFEKIKAARTFRSGSMMLRQLYFGMVDFELHHRHVPGSAPVLDVQRRVAARTTVIPPLPEDRFLNGFTHIFAGGYAAGYYGYKWAEVLSADAFGAFEEAGLGDAAAVTAVGARFRDTVLALGGSVHPSDVFRRFRGRDPEPTALLRHAGLAA
ncbi:MAG: M3 family metallopeptidase [Deltaproteobacteria bacterium]|nr:M3 family metallopeptidase [Deltaproteobacteria bacterium]